MIGMLYELLQRYRIMIFYKMKFMDNNFSYFSNILNYSCSHPLKNCFGMKQQQDVRIEDRAILSKIFQYSLKEDLNEARKFSLISKAIKEEDCIYYATVFNNTRFDGKSKIENFLFLNNRHQNKIGHLTTQLNFINKGFPRIEDIIRTIRLCPNLESIELNFFWFSLNSILQALKESCPKLHSVAFYHLFITEQALSILAQCHNLQSLSMEWCRISQKDLKDVSQLPNLKRLSIRHCYLTDQATMDLAQCTTHLYTLSIDSCDNITDQTIVALGNCHNLQTLSIDNCPNVSAQAVSELNRINPKIRIVRNGFPFIAKPGESPICSKLLERVSIFFWDFLQKKN